MSSAQFNYRLHHAAIYHLSTSTADRLAGRAAQSVQARARRFAPQRTGALALSIEIKKIESGERTTYKVGSDLNYAGYQEWGTGPIVPDRAKVLRFQTGGVTVFAMRTRGVPATHFMARAGAGITLADFL